MSDAYLNFANSAFGARVASLLGLPQPVPLERFALGQPVVDGEVLVAAGGEPQLLPVLLRAFAAMQARTVAHGSVPAWASSRAANSRRWCLTPPACATPHRARRCTPAFMQRRVPSRLVVGWW